ncbi:MAG: tRNA (5-methylaminomethyl-2-thiouridine)(34)-methyltransferase MnmD [Pseudomonadota bacterium]
MKGAPRSEQFNDIYFSADDGLAETQHVFINGNNLPQAWENSENFVICETGFGTGLNFLAAWHLFEKTAHTDQTLDFISFEKYPLTPDEIQKALEPWQSHFDEKIKLLCENYPISVRGFHRIKINSQITFTLIFDDVNEAIPELDANVDSWFLDGFTPTKNPDMWSVTLFENMARLSKEGASFATFTAAGDVRRGLEDVGFIVEKSEGFGRKRDMIKGHYKSKEKTKTILASKLKPSIAIVGGGLAGTSVAYALKQYGFDPVIYEQEGDISLKASGNDIGFFNPRFTALWDGVGQFFAPAYAQFITMAKQAGDAINYKPCGALHLINSPEKEKRFYKMLSNWNWAEDHTRIVDAKEASEIAGIELDLPALYLPDAGSVSPQKLCHHYVADITRKCNQTITSLEDLEEDIIILANAHSVSQFFDEDILPVNSVRGQITKIQASQMSSKIKCNIHYGGYISQSLDSTHYVGASFQPWLDHDDIIDDDNVQNIQKMKTALPQLAGDDFEVLHAWAGLRTAAKDKFPIAGKISKGGKDIYVSLAYGSHGLVGSLKSAHYLCDLIRKGPCSIQFETKKSISYQRFSAKK